MYEEPQFKAIGNGPNPVYPGQQTNLRPKVSSDVNSYDDQLALIEGQIEALKLNAPPEIEMAGGGPVNASDPKYMVYQNYLAKLHDLENKKSELVKKRNAESAWRSAKSNIIKAMQVRGAY